MSDIIQIIKKLAVDAVESKNPTQVLFGFVNKISPLEIRINQNILLTERFLVLGSNVRAMINSNQMQIGTRILLIREQGGQKFLASDIITDDAWLPQYSKIENVVNQYQVSDSSVDVPIGKWIEDIPDWEENKFLWIREKITYKNPFEIAYTTAFCDKTWSTVSDFLPQFENIKVDIEKTANSIRHEVSSEYLSYGDFQKELASMINQTDDKIQFQFEESKKLSDDVLQQLNDEIIKRQSYINFSDEGIELGKKDNKFSTVLDNQSLKFKEDDMVVASISNKKMNVSSANISENFTLFDKLKFEKRSNGNISINLM